MRGRPTAPLVLSAEERAYLERTNGRAHALVSRELRSFGLLAQQHPPTMTVGPTVTMAWPPMHMPADASSVSSETSYFPGLVDFGGKGGVLVHRGLPTSQANPAGSVAMWVAMSRFWARVRLGYTLPST